MTLNLPDPAIPANRPSICFIHNCESEWAQLLFFKRRGPCFRGVSPRNGCQTTGEPDRDCIACDQSQQLIKESPFNGKEAPARTATVSSPTSRSSSELVRPSALFSVKGNSLFGRCDWSGTTQSRSGETARKQKFRF